MKNRTKNLLFCLKDDLDESLTILESIKPVNNDWEKTLDARGKIEKALEWLDKAVAEENKI